MKKSLLRFVVGLILVCAGIAVTVLHFCKVVPNGWESSMFLKFITIIWAYFGLFVGPILTVAGIYLFGIFDKFVNRYQD